MEEPSEIIESTQHVSTMQKDGVVVIRDIIQSEQIARLKDETVKIYALIKNKIPALTRPLRTYSDIAERQPGRLDFRCGFSADIFAEAAKPITKIITEMSPTIDFRHYWGAIPSQAGSGPTDMHRDIYPIQNTTQNQDISELDCELPPYYFTVLIPLIEMTKDLGPTVFIKGSHKTLSVDLEQSSIYAPLLSLGDLVIFEGRTLHRGGANQTQSERLVAYITYVANWYHDQTFEMNDHLFPELLNSDKTKT